MNYLSPFSLIPGILYPQTNLLLDVVFSHYIHKSHFWFSSWPHALWFWRSGKGPVGDWLPCLLVNWWLSVALGQSFSTLLNAWPGMDRPVCRKADVLVASFSNSWLVPVLCFRGVQIHVFAWLFNSSVCYVPGQELAAAGDLPRAIPGRIPAGGRGVPGPGVLGRACPGVVSCQRSLWVCCCDPPGSLHNSYWTFSWELSSDSPYGGAVSPGLVCLEILGSGVLWTSVAPISSGPLI